MFALIEKGDASWIGLHANATSGSLKGIDGFSASVDNIDLKINKSTGANGTVVDFSQSPVQSGDVTLDYATETFSVNGVVSLNIFDFFTLTSTPQRADSLRQMGL